MNATKKRPLLILYQKIDQLKPLDQNARTHSPRQVRKISKSILAFGFANPILVDRYNRIVAGHGRVKAAALLGMTEVPTICLEDLNEDEIRAYVIADNRLAEDAGWDHSILAIELQHLMTIEEAEFDVTVTGFEIPEIDLILAEANQEDRVQDPVQEPNPDHEPISQAGDVWIMGKHRVLCGNSLHDASYKKLMGAHKAACVFSDPPYNVKIDGHATGNGAIHHREFAMASGDFSEAEFFSFLTNAIQLLSKYSLPNAIAFLCIDWRHIEMLIRAAKQSYDQLANICVWVKDQGGMGSFYRSQHEFVAVFRRGPGPSRNNVQLGKFGRNRTNVWTYPGVQTQSKQGEEGNLLALHPTVKPVGMVADALLDCTARGEVVLDAFLGSGTTLMAAERVGRVCYGMEFDPHYVDVTIRRWQNQTGEKAIHSTTRKAFGESRPRKEKVRG